MQAEGNTTRQQVRTVLAITLAFNLLVAAGKIFIGLVSGALAITADGFHSLIDGASNVVGLIASAIASRPPDAEHPYGHRRYETLAALLIGAFLLLVAWEIANGALQRLGSGDLPQLTPLTFAVMFGTLLVNVSVNLYQTRRGKALNSELLLADAANTRADVFITLSVIASMVLVRLTGWAWIDVAAALAVVVLIGRAGWRILNQTGGVLVDTAPYTADDLTHLLADMPCAQQVVRARSRGTADAAHVDIDISVPPSMTARETEAIAADVRQRVHDGLAGVSEVEVHFVPDVTAPPDYARIVRAAADPLGLDTHEVTVIHQDDDTLLEAHVEVPPEQSLSAAHARVTRLERALRQQLTEVDEIVTHIEPARTQALACDGLAEAERERVQTEALNLLNSHYPRVDWHDLRVVSREDGLALTLHAALTPEVSVERAHILAEDAETLLRAEMPAFTRVTIHTEPYDHP